MITGTSVWNRISARQARFRGVLCVLLLVALAGSASFGKDKKKKKGADVDTSGSVEADKVLFDRAMDDLHHGRYTEGRLTLQALINAYPDSEYLAKAKLAWGDSFYKEGGTENLTLAIQQYQDFITFFGPVLPDSAAYAQMQIAMSHYRMMEKPDRDSSETQQAEQAFQTFLLTYPQSPLKPKVEQHLRDVQEVLADSEFRIGQFYYVKQDYQAAAARLMGVSERYPLYSRSDQAVWMLGSIYMKAKQVSKNEDDRNHWADLAGDCYNRLARDYPLSPFAPEARSRLRGMGMKVPAPDAQAVARMKAQQLYAKKHHRHIVTLPLALFHSGPNVTASARFGQPNLTQPSDVISATTVLRPGAAGPDFDAAAKASAAVADTGDAPAGGDPDAASPPDASPPADATPGAAISVQPLTPVDGGGATSNDPARPASGTASAPAPQPASVTPAAPPPNSPPPPGGATGSATPAPSQASGTGANTSAADSQAPAAQVSTAASSRAKKKTESTSKKKKGLHKLIP